MDGNSTEQAVSNAAGGMGGRSKPRRVRIGLAGLGNVGAGVFKNLRRNRDLLVARTGVELEVKRICMRDLSRQREVDVSGVPVTADWRELTADPDIDIIVELIGGTDQAYRLVTAALKAGKIVVTGNKALLAERGKELITLAEEQRVPLYFEAAVAGGIPIIKAVGEALVGNRIEAILGIVNGTSNFILTRMTKGGLSYGDALAEAQSLGYAEADPTLDVNGWDAGHKAIILAWLSYGFWIRPEDVHVEGVENVHRADIAFAEGLGYSLKLLAVIRLHPNDEVEVRVQPSMIRKNHILASVDGVFNAVAVRGDVVGETLFYGSGAGQDATSSAVISDLADAAESIRTKGEGEYTGFLPHGRYGRPKPVEETISRYYLRLKVEDRPGVIAELSRTLAAHDIGISSVIQPESEEDASQAELMIMAHEAPFGVMKQAVEEISALDCVTDRPVFLRVESI